MQKRPTEGLCFGQRPGRSPSCLEQSTPSAQSVVPARGRFAIIAFSFDRLYAGHRHAADPVVVRLLSLPGVGPVTTWLLRAEIGRFDRLRTSKHLSRFGGLSPRNASRGTRQAGVGLITAANRELRTVLTPALHKTGGSGQAAG